MVITSEKSEIKEVKRVTLPNGKVIRLYVKNPDDNLKSLKNFTKEGER